VQHGTRVNLLLVVGSLLVGLLFFEIGIRFGITTSPGSWGRLGHIELPPVPVLAPDAFMAMRSGSHPGGVVFGGKELTDGDLTGIKRSDAVLGYVTAESATSDNGWWQSNNLGARSRTDATATVPSGVRRILIFGESFAHGSALPQEETFAALLADGRPDLEVLNFAVDGYSMAQAFLRFRRVREVVDYDHAVLVFVPPADLARDINTLRTLIGWRGSIVLPRFELEGDRLVLVPGPYRTYQEMRERNAGGVSAELRRHLVDHDRLYFPAKYEEIPVVGRLVTAKLVARALYTLEERRIHDSLRDVDSEAQRVSRAIFAAMAREVAADGKRFDLVLLPTIWDYAPYERDPAFRLAWDAMVASIRAEGVPCIDMMPVLRDAEKLDRAYDRKHYGPRANRAIADALREPLGAGGPAQRTHAAMPSHAPTISPAPPETLASTTSVQAPSP